MNKKLIAGLGCLGAMALFVVIIVMWVASAYNGMVVKQEEAKTAWNNIEVILKRNQQDLNALENILADVKDLNKSTLENMVAARAKATQMVIDPTNTTPEQMREWSAAQGELSQAIGRLMVIHEADYPELKGNEHYTHVMTELEGSVNRLGEARRKYNEAVKGYMVKTRTFPNVLFAGIFGFGPMYGYEAPAGTEENTTDFSGLRNK